MKNLLSKKNMIFVLFVLALVAVLFISRMVDPRVEFKDKGLEEAIRDALGNQNRPICKDDLLNITILDASGKEITCLDGIEYLHNLTFLNLEDNNIEDVSPLKNLKKLVDLNLSNNGIADLEKINFNSISGLPLIVLNLNHNIAKGDGDNYIRLSDISLIGQFKQLEELYLRENSIEDISPLSNLNNLEILDLRENAISNISPLKNLISLKELNLRENNVVDISALAELKELEYLNIHSNREIESIAPIADLTNLKTLIMRNVNIRNEVELLKNLKNLERLNIRNCDIPDISFIAGLTKLKELDLRYNNDVVDISALSNLKELEYLDLYSNKYVESIAPIADLANLKTLIIENLYRINDIELLGNLKNLQILDMHDCRVQDISFISRLTNLKELNLSYNNARDFSPLGNLNNLEILDLSSTGITDLSSLKNVTSLKELDLRDNSGIKDISALSNLKELEYLNLNSSKGVESIAPITNLTNLKTLILRNVNVGDEVNLLKNLKNLERLNIRNCNIPDISFVTGLTKLKELKLRDNIRIKDISALSNLKEMEYLNIHSNNKIESIAPITNLTNLKTLIMRNVNAGEEAELLTDLVNLQRLNIRNCNISDISFIARLFESGALQDNPLTDEKATIDIRDNPVFESSSDEDKLESIRPYWKNINLKTPFVLPDPPYQLEPPVFSCTGGFYKEEFLLEIETNDPEAKIYYTLDGSEPDESSSIYTGPIKIDSRRGEPNVLSEITTSPDFKEPVGEVFKVTVVRARAIKDSDTISSVVTHTYIVDESNEGSKNRYSLPVISISTDSDNLFNSDYGIFVQGTSFNEERRYQSGNYTKKGGEWERPIHIEFFEPDGTPGFSQNAGLRIHGNSTRNTRIKALRIYASDLYDDSDMFNYPIFPGLLKPNSNESLTDFNNFILRNSGNDYNETYFRDGILQSLVSHLGLDTQAYRPAVVFINGEYWGIYNIRERYDKWYFATRYGVDIDEVVTLEGPEGIVKTGKPEDNIPYLEMVEFVKKNINSGTINNPDIYAKINTLIDIDNFINYFATEIFFGNTDWPQHNIGFWRTKTETYEPDAPYGHDGRWRCMMFDIDYGFGLWNRSAEDDALDHAAGINALFASLLENNEFRYQFINTMADLLNSIFRPEYTVAKIEEAKSVLAPEMPEHLKRWNYLDGSIEHWDKEVREMIDFAVERPSFQIQHIIEFFSLSGTVEINLITDSQKGYIKINSLELKEVTPGIENPSNWKGIYFKEIPVTITAIPYPGYEFSGWDGIDNNNLSITITPEEDLTLTAVFSNK
ncbi:MAG: CotH kinase family protein [Actinomycetota bacterium]|nr:CotH kinase family protein [Actinomycetota bacterium]